MSVKQQRYSDQIPVVCVCESHKLTSISSESQFIPDFRLLVAASGHSFWVLGWGHLPFFPTSGATGRSRHGLLSANLREKSCLHSLRSWVKPNLRRDASNTSAEAGGPWTLHSFAIEVSEIFLLVPFALPRRVFTNTGGLKISSSVEVSLLFWALLAFSSSGTSAASFSCSWKSPHVSKYRMSGRRASPTRLVLPDFPLPSADNAAWSLQGAHGPVFEQENQVCEGYIKRTLLHWSSRCYICIVRSNKLWLYYLLVGFKSEFLSNTS